MDGWTNRNGKEKIITFPQTVAIGRTDGRTLLFI